MVFANGYDERDTFRCPANRRTDRHCGVHKADIAKIRACRIQSILPEFQKLYEKVGGKLFELLQMTDSYIVICVSNALYQALVINCQQANQKRQAFGQPPQYSEVEIENYKSEIIDIQPQREKLFTAMEEISKYNQNEIQRLSALAREYIALKQQNAYNKCFPAKEG